MSSGKVVAKKNGYVYVYTSNESQQDVLFDNFGVTQITGPVLEEIHYYPFGLTMAGISTTAPLKLEGRRKFNGIEFNHKEFGDGSGLELYTAKFRGLDPQIGRWWQIDPMSDDQKNELERWSPYVSNYDNPIRYSDPKGDCPSCIGALIGAATDYSIQVAANFIEGKDVKEALTEVDVKSIMVSAAAGAVSGGISSISKIRNASILVRKTVEVGVDAASSATGQYVKTGKVNLSKVTTDVILGQTVGGIAGKGAEARAGSSTEAKALERSANRAERISAQPKRSAARQAAKQKAAQAARSKADNYVTQRGAGASVSASNVSSGVFEIVIYNKKEDKNE